MGVHSGQEANAKRERRDGALRPASARRPAGQTRGGTDTTGQHRTRASQSVNRGSQVIAATVAVAAFIWLAATTQHWMPWDSPGETVRVTPGAFLVCAYMAAVFTSLAPRIHARLSGHRDARTFAYVAEGFLWHALAAPFLIFAGLGVYFCFALAGGTGMAAFRWLNCGN